jgi:hypothetical protein
MVGRGPIQRVTVPSSRTWNVARLTSNISSSAKGCRAAGGNTAVSRLALAIAEVAAFASESDKPAAPNTGIALIRHCDRSAACLRAMIPSSFSCSYIKHVLRHRWPKLSQKSITPQVKNKTRFYIEHTSPAALAAARLRSILLDRAMPTGSTFSSVVERLT